MARPRKNAEKKDINNLTAEDICTTPARKILFQCLMQNWQIKDAAKEAGLSERYAYNLVEKSRMNALVLRETKANTEDRLVKRLRQLDKIIDNPETTITNCLKAIDLQGKMCGWQSTTTVLETHNRQNELTELERVEARRLALLRFNALPGAEQPVIDVEPVERQVINMPEFKKEPESDYAI